MPNATSDVKERAIRDGVVRLIQTHGATKAARLLGMQRETTLAVAAGAHVQPGTLALTAERLARVDPNEPVSGLPPVLA